MDIVATILSLLKFVADKEPQVEASIREVLKKNDPTTADWDAEIARVRALDFKTLVPDNTLPPDPPAPPTAA